MPAFLKKISQKEYRPDSTELHRLFWGIHMFIIPIFGHWHVLFMN